MWFFVVIVVDVFIVFSSEIALCHSVRIKDFTLINISSRTAFFFFLLPGAALVPRLPWVIQLLPLQGNKRKSGLPCSDKPLFCSFLTMIATSFHGIAKSFCATTKYLSSNSSSYIFQAYFIKTKNLLLGSRPLYFEKIQIWL